MPLLLARPAQAWASALSRLPAGGLWLTVWLAALAVVWLPAAILAPLAALAWLSALVLAGQGRRGRRLTAAAFFFLAFWALLSWVISLVWPASLRPVLNLAAWLPLGLHLMLAKTPLELALSAAAAFRPLLGRANSQKLALALALLARLIPGLLISALDIRAVINQRAPGLSPARRLSLWGRALIREALAQPDDLSRVLLKRWPW